ncbi:hypothetical protein P152DRAFT_477528 [Eremomyces bilateralis CBS 781.70]|uniref:Uncharacterized protein n=1 Tax=Eremomyces bilateralis CBS 781.70 TaxID=1392243 RepID=A0A6G1FQZ4_9PEZI|nr:uncharacterized protein P152DRAFT_477528 [Eremomyces bilateralis CBS 781.70]KAF1808214.1 hypothetical protein P152DRAFT_477528 [Eremomyces bilateralis CBS 781.70]
MGESEDFNCAAARHHPRRLFPLAQLASHRQLVPKLADPRRGRELFLGAAISFIVGVASLTPPATW